MPREHGDSGEFVETTPVEDVREVFDAVDGPVVLSADVADHLGCSRETARRKLKTLFDRGELDRRKVARRVIYWRADDTRNPGPERDAESGRETPETPSTPQGDQSDSAGYSPSTRAVTSALDGWQYGRSSQERNASRAVAVQATEWLRDQSDTVRKADVPLEELADNDTLDRDASTLWTQVVRDAWQHAADHGFIEQPHSRGYRWVGSDGDQDVDSEV